MATTKFLDYSGLEYLIGKLKSRQFSGMGLSTEDFSTDLKTKLEALYQTLGEFDPDSVASEDDFQNLVTKVDGLVAIFNEAGEDDGDKIINKLNEVFAFLAEISSDDKLKALLAGKADNATTLSGYGITDAKIEEDENGVSSITLGDQTLTPALKDDTDKALQDVNDELALKMNEADLVAITNPEIDAMIAPVVSEEEEEGEDNS